MDEKIRDVQLESDLQPAVISATFLRKNVDGKTEVLLVQGSSGKWYLPGGKMREGESMEMTLRRELKEELGIDYAGSFSSFNIGSYTVSGEKLAIANVTALNPLPTEPRLQGGDTIKAFTWTGDPLGLDLSDKARATLTDQMSSQLLLEKK